MRNSDVYIGGIFVGVAGLLAVKYWLVGLERWNSVFHPYRVEDYRKLTKGTA